jgi:hypothetical protein
MEVNARNAVAAFMQQPLQLRAAAPGCHHNKPNPKPLPKNLQLLTLRAAAAGDSWSFTPEWHTLLAKYVADVMSRNLSPSSEDDVSTALNFLDCVRDFSLLPMKNVTL